MVTETDEKLNGTTCSVEEMAAILHISRAAAYNAVRNKQVPALFFSARRIRIPLAALKKMLETGQQPEAKTEQK